MTVGGDDETVAGTTLQGVMPASAVTPQLVAERYEIVRWLGGGGMGRVYEAHDRELGERVALKVLNSGLSEEAIERFRREVRLTRRIQHRNIARMFDIGEHAGDRFLTMELVDGVSLAREVSSRALAWSRLKLIAEQICAGLAAAHDAGVIHRDLKPDNVLIERATDRVVITDFGIARSLDDASVTQVGAVVGTPRYMAPEQLAGRDVDTRADLFALGVMLFELATGTRPWSGDNAITIAVAMATTPPRAFPQAGLPASFVGIVQACLQLEPVDRPANAREIAEAISHAGDVDDHVLPVAARITTSTRATPVTHAVEATSLAVVPLSCAPPDEYLADGILEDLVDALSSTAGLRVRPAGVVRKSSEDPRELGKRLEVDHVVSASLRRIPTGLRVSARLIGVADGFQIWAHKADCAEAEVLAVAETLARGIAAALSTRASVATRPTDPRAVDLYLRARAEMRRFWGVHATAAADLLEQAAVFAPSSPPILGALAYASVLAWVMRGEPVMADRARAALERGLASGHGEAYLASASWLLNHGEHERGAADLANALIRAPMSAPTHEMTGRILIEVGLPVEARKHFDTAIGLDPGRATIINTDLARMDALVGNWASADARVTLLRNDPDEAIAQLGWVFEARLAGWRGDRDAVLAAAQRYVPKMGDNATRMMDFVASSISTGNVDTERWTKLPEMYAGQDRPRRQQLLGLQLLSEMAIVLGMDDVARDTLRQAVALGLIDTYWLGHCPLFVRFRDDSWFSEIRQGVADSASRVLTSFTAIAAP